MADMSIEKIKTHPTFESLFPINPKVLAKIEHDMREDSFDQSQPIIVGTWEGQDEPVCIDDHTRLKAARNADIAKVPVVPYEFETEEEAFEYAIRLQTNRRNLTDGDLLQCIERIHEPRPRGGDRKSEAAKSRPQSCGKKGGRSAGAKDTADLLNICARKVEQALTVIRKASPEVKEAVMKNEMSINKAYKKTQKQQKQAEAESTAEVSQGQAAEEGQESEGSDGGETSKYHAAVYISMGHFEALHKLGGSIEDHLASAIDLYLGSLKEQDHVNCDTDSTAADEEDQGESDDDEYFDPDAYGDD